MADDVRVHARGLGRSYPGVEALVDVDLDVRAGSVLGVLGHNGAGKSTLVDILCTRTLPTAGEARVAGFDVVRDGHEVRRRIGVTSQSVAVDEAISGRANLVLVGRLFGAARRAADERATAMLERFGLTEAADRLPGTYSGGMRRRLDLAMSLLGEPEVLFLDEPTTGLDPVAKTEVWAFVAALAGGGTTVVLTTQDLDEAEQLASQVLVLGRGRVVATGTPAELKAGVGQRTASVQVGDGPAGVVHRERGVAALSRYGIAARSDDDAGRLVVTLLRPADVATAVRTLLAAEVPVLDLDVREPTLVDVYLALHREATAVPAPVWPPVPAVAAAS